ncbi:MAG: hypothetical protein O7E52_21765 [Candidatus Poribacteria bacterium]|nr:hypothetical protein [Candidatus Poribacteria bacterium]
MKDNALISKFRTIEREITQEKGAFTLFALIQGEGVWDKWDVVVAAPWVRDDLKETLDYFVEKMRKVPHQEELLKVSKIVPLDPSWDFVQEIINESNKHGNGTLRNIEINGIEIRRAHILTPTLSHQRKGL